MATASGGYRRIVDLPVVLEGTTRVIVVRGSSYDARRRKNNEVLAVVETTKRLTSLASALVVGDERDRTTLMTPAHPTLALLAGDDVLATISLFGVTWVRSTFWTYDRPVTYPALLLAWLAINVPQLGYTAQVARGSD